MIWTVVRGRMLLEQAEHGALDMVLRRGASARDNEVVQSTEVERASISERRRLMDAIRQAKRITSQNPGAVSAADYRALARELKKAGMFEEAAQAYLDAWNADRSDPRPLSYAGIIYSRDLHDYDRAARLYQQAINADPSYFPAYYNRACNEARREDADKAIELLAEALKRDPGRSLDLIRKDSQTGGCFVGIVNDPRFIKLIQQYNSPSGSTTQT